MAFLDRYLFLKKSVLEEAGKGLFTRIEIPKGTVITEYKGRFVFWKDVKHLDGYNAYLFKINRQFAIDAEKYYKSFGRYANDARGFSRITGLRNNSEYVVYNNRCYISSIRKIQKGEEILVPYGKEYWDLLKKIYGK